jgi:hypothetical protein
MLFGSGDPVSQGYTYANYAGDEDSRKSTSGYLMTYVGGGSVMSIKVREMCFIMNRG